MIESGGVTESGSVPESGCVAESGVGGLLYLFISHIFSVGGGRLLHGCQTKNLEKMVLHDITDYPKLVKVAATPHCAKRLLEGDGHRGDAVPVPQRLEDGVSKPSGGGRERVQIK